MRKSLLLLAFLFISIMSLTGCNKIDEIKDIKFTVGNKNINYQVYNTSYSADKARNEFFKYSFNDNTNDIKLIKFGEKVYFDFGNNEVDEIIVKDHLLDSNGHLMYSEREILDREITYENNTSYFVIDRHFASLLSSKLEINKKEYRGFVIITKMGKTERLYTFVVGT